MIFERKYEMYDKNDNDNSVVCGRSFLVVEMFLCFWWKFILCICVFDFLFRYKTRPGSINIFKIIGILGRNGPFWFRQLKLFQ